MATVQLRTTMMGVIFVAALIAAIHAGIAFAQTEEPPVPPTDLAIGTEVCNAPPAEGAPADGSLGVGISDLNTCIAKDSTDSFSVVTHNPADNTTYTVEIHVESRTSGSVGFGASCSDASQVYDPTVTTELRGCDVALGMVYAVLKLDGAEVARSAKQPVFIIEPATAGEDGGATGQQGRELEVTFRNRPFFIDQGASETFDVIVSNLDTRRETDIRLEVEDFGTIGFNSFCSSKYSGWRHFGEGASQQTATFTMHGCKVGTKTVYVTVIQSETEFEEPPVLAQRQRMGC